MLSGTVAGVAAATAAWWMLGYLDQYLLLDMKATVGSMAVLTRSRVKNRDHHLFPDMA